MFALAPIRKPLILPAMIGMLRLLPLTLPALTSLILARLAAEEEECRLYTYRAKITEVVDGDTVYADVDLGFRIHVNHEKFRLAHIDAPETQSRGGRIVTEEEKAAGLRAKEALTTLIQGRHVELCTLKDSQGKYGRYLARIFLDGLDVNQWLVDQGFAAPYGDRSAALN